MEKEAKSMKRASQFFFAIALLAIMVGLTLTLLSIFEVCTSSCVEGHKYRLFNLTFEEFGLLFFIPTLLSLILSLRIALFEKITAFLLASGVGGELYFLYVQKYIIGSWCPICLGIAATLFTAASSFAIYSTIRRKLDEQQKPRGNIMKRATFSLLTAAIGFTAAFIGVSKVNPLEAKQESLKESITFGNSKSPIEVYVFTDWFCAACHELEPEFKRMAPNVEREAKLFFIDANIHDDSINFTPYNLSFMIYNKPNYFDLRAALVDMSEHTDAPSDTEVQKKISPLSVTLKELNYRDIALAAKMFTKLKQQFKVTSTPTVVVVNLETKKGKRINGGREITSDNVLKAINELK